MAGGFDHRVVENVEHHDELKSLADELKLTDDDVVFLKSPSDAEKLRLLRTSHALLYTPSGEILLQLLLCCYSLVSVQVHSDKLILAFVTKFTIFYLFIGLRKVKSC